MPCEAKGVPVGAPPDAEGLVAIVRTKAFTPTDIRGFLKSSEGHDLIKHKLFIKKQDPTVANSSPDGSHLCPNPGPSAPPPAPVCSRAGRRGAECSVGSRPASASACSPGPPSGSHSETGSCPFKQPPAHFPGLLYLKSKRMLFQDRSALAN